MPQIAFLKDRFDLTPAEARLVARLMTGESLRSCAKALGIKYETLRGQLKSVFQKTKTHRQTELVLTVFHAMSKPPAFAAHRDGISS
jgi:DNA-binding CsgD family transcriptional regulator